MIRRGGRGVDASEAGPGTIDDLLAAERSAEAAAQLDAIGESGSETVCYLRLRTARLRGGSVDRFVIALDELAARELAPALRVRVLAQLALGFAEKRCRGRAEATLAALDAIDAAPSRRAEARGSVDLAFDRRAEAIAAFELAARGDEPCLGELGLARAHYIEGRFDAALVHARRAEPYPLARVAALRRQAAIARVRGQWAERLRLVDAVIAATPGGDYARDDRLDRASALYAGGRRDEAIAELRALASERDDDAPGRFARGVIDHVESAGAGTGTAAADSRRVVLSLPTVRQKRDFCGPAVLEMIVRALGSDGDDASQDAIAARIHADAGTSTYALARYLAELGLHTIRFEATAERLEACLALGVPVIVEQEFATTYHVAVAIGFDRALGVVYVQDPASHVTREELASAHVARGALFRNSALVALRSSDPRRAQLAAAGVTDARHIRLVDEVDRPELRGDPERQIALLDEAIAACEDYPLAWSKRLRAEQAAARSRSRFLAALRVARTRYPDLELAHQIHADWLVAEERFEEALIELAAAQRIDPRDANSVQDEAECHQRLGRHAEATAAFWRALALDPAHVRAMENFAALALDTGDLPLAAHFSACALDVAPDNPFNHQTATRLAIARGDRAEIAARAKAGLAVAPDHELLKLWLSQTGP